MTDPIKFKNYLVGFRVTSELMEDSDLPELENYLTKMRQDCAEHLADSLYADIAGVPRKLRTPWIRFKEWLGWKVWQLAMWINPDVGG